MFFLFAGIPDAYFDRVVQRAREQLRGHQFTAISLRIDINGNYNISEEHLDRAVRALHGYWRGRQSCFDSGFATIIVKSKWDRAECVWDKLFPFSLIQTIEVTDPVQRSGRRRNMMANRVADDIVGSALSLARPANALRTELQDRLKRTPLLLPIRHFDALELKKLLRDVGERIKYADNCLEVIREACKEFEQKYPFAKVKKSGRFTNRRGVVFTMPGRALHGKVWFDANSEEHNELCRLNAILRLGAPVAQGFHFDCTKDGTRHSGTFENCHDERRQYTGSPHLNVYPNDYIRT